MEVSALKYHGGIGLHARSPLLRLQSDERLVALTRRGNSTAFETLVGRYESRLLAFCRHMLASREDAEDVLQEVMAAAFNAMLADERPINVKPWLYRIARNRSLNHLRRVQPVGVDSMDIHFADNGTSTADKVHEREEFRLLVGDINELPETQKTALVLREMDALSYEQIAEAMETTVPSVKSLLVRARVSLAEAAEARLLSCEEVRIELGEAAEGLRRRPSPLVRRHLKSCQRCESFRVQLKETNKALAAFMPIGPLVVLKKLVLAHAGHSASSTGASAGAAGSTAAGGGVALSSGGFLTAGVGAVAAKAAAGLAAAALVTAGAVEINRSVHASPRPSGTHETAALAPGQVINGSEHTADVTIATTIQRLPAIGASTTPGVLGKHLATTTSKKLLAAKDPKATAATASTAAKTLPVSAHLHNGKTTLTTPASPTAPKTTTEPPGRTQKQTDPTVLSPTATVPLTGGDGSTSGGSGGPTGNSGSGGGDGSSGGTGSGGPTDTSGNTPSGSTGTGTTPVPPLSGAPSPGTSGATAGS